MRLNSILNRYLFKEMLSPFVISIMFFTFVFLMAKILDITNLMINYSINLTSVVMLLLYTIPHFLEFVIPMSVMVSVLVTFMRLAGDNEIVAMKAGGFSLYRLLPPVMAFCLIGSVLTAFMTICGVPWGRLALKKLTCEIISSNLDIGLKERTFNDMFKGVMIYINRVDIKNKTIADVFIEDQRDKDIVSTIVSPEGVIFSDPAKLFFKIRLYNGVINRVDLEKRSVQTINFGTYDINLDINKAGYNFKKIKKKGKDMSLSELRDYLKKKSPGDEKYIQALMEYYRKFSIPFACFALGLLAVPLGVQTSSAKRSYGLGLGLFFIFLYYLLMSAGFVFGEAGLYPPVIGMWVPDIVIGGIAIFLLVRAAGDSPVNIMFLYNFFSRLYKKVFKSS
ncbi:MAG: LPS export ABC transporter permease LptF [Deltaproteobacteria bacterium]|nr:LPS export ABC transporter permease LptF [Deltaproteobacteria bacterium]